jgi:hypothetical protein
VLFPPSVECVEYRDFLGVHISLLGFNWRGRGDHAAICI